MLVSKYNASGNDFIITTAFIEKDYSSIAKKLCNRQFIGADGFIVLVPHNKFDFKWLFYNSDGSIASMCGNGSRAAAMYAVENNLVKDNNISFLTLAGEINCQIISSTINNKVVKTKFSEYKIIDRFNENGLDIFFVDTGVPHLVIYNKEFDKDLAKKLRYKYNANVNFFKKEDNYLLVRTYERGVEDETLACGTGMAASFLYARELNLVDDNSIVYPKSKEEIYIELQNNNLYFQGNVEYILSTKVDI